MYVCIYVLLSLLTFSVDQHEMQNILPPSPDAKCFHSRLCHANQRYFHCFTPKNFLECVRNEVSSVYTISVAVYAVSLVPFSSNWGFEELRRTCEGIEAQMLSHLNGSICCSPFHCNPKVYLGFYSPEEQ